MKYLSSIGTSGGPGSGSGCNVAPVVGHRCVGGLPVGGDGVPSPLFASVVADCACSGIGGGGYPRNLLDGGVVVILSGVVWESGCVGVTLVSFWSCGLEGGGALYSRAVSLGPVVFLPLWVLALPLVLLSAWWAFWCRVPLWRSFRL